MLLFLHCKGVTSRSFCTFLAQTILKIVVGNLKEQSRGYFLYFCHKFAKFLSKDLAHA